MKKYMMILAFSFLSFNGNASEKSLNQSTFIDYFAGRSVNCQIGYVSEKLMEGTPMNIDFKLAKITLSFDTDEIRETYSRFNMNHENMRDLFIIGYQVKTKQGVLTNYFSFSRIHSKVYENNNKLESISYTNNLKSVSITTKDGYITDKYIFKKNGITLFACTEFDLI